MNNVHRGKARRQLGHQKGVAVIEFPFVVLAVVSMVWGMVSVYRLIDMRLQLDNVAFSLANSVAVTETIPESSSQEFRVDLEKDVLTLAQQLLPESLSENQVGIIVESIRENTSNNRWESEQKRGGYPCTLDNPIEQQTGLSPKGNHSDVRLTKRAGLIQITVCIDDPFFNLSALLLPEHISSAALMIYRKHLSD